MAKLVLSPNLSKRDIDVFLTRAVNAHIDQRIQNIRRAVESEGDTLHVSETVGTSGVKNFAARVVTTNDSVVNPSGSVMRAIAGK